MSTFMIPKDGAWQEPEAVRRKPDGAWVEAEFARRIIDGAFQDVWTNALKFALIANTLSSGSGSSGDFESGMKWLTGECDSGSLTYVVEGDFYNPTLSFLYEIWAVHNNNQIPGGYVYAYGVRADGTVDEISMVSSANTMSFEQASYTFTGGSYKKIGFRYQGADWGVDSITIYANICQVTIDGKKCVFNPDDNFNFN